MPNRNAEDALDRAFNWQAALCQARAELRDEQRKTDRMRWLLESMIGRDDIPPELRDEIDRALVYIDMPRADRERDEETANAAAAMLDEQRLAR
jgi:hypothetical protein